MRNLTFASISVCANCPDRSYCHFCPQAHLLVTHGELREVNPAVCAYTRLKREFVETRNEVADA